MSTTVFSHTWPEGIVLDSPPSVKSRLEILETGVVETDTRLTALEESVSAVIQTAYALVLIDAGQSNDVGRASQVSTIFPSKLRTFNGGPAMLVSGQTGFVNATWSRPAADFASLVDYSAPETDKEPSPAGFAARDTYYRTIVAFGAAVGGRHWSEMNPGNGPFNNVQMAMMRAHDLLVAAGYQSQNIDCVIRWALGEQNADNSPVGGSGSETPVTESEWETICAAALTAYRRAWRFVTRDPSRQITLLASPCAITAGDGYRNVQKGMLDYALTSTEFICVGPRYGWSHEGDGIHLFGLGQRLRSEYDALRLAQIRADYTKRLPLYVTAVDWSGTTLTVTFNRDCEIDTTTLSNTDASFPNSMHGIEIFDDAVAVDIVSGSMTSGNVYTATTAASPSGAKTGRIGQMTWPGGTQITTLNNSANKMARSNFREPTALSSTEIGGTTYELYSWACQQSLPF